MGCKTTQQTYNFTCGEFIISESAINPFCEIFINNNFINIISTNSELMYKWTFILDEENIIETEYKKYFENFTNYPFSNFNSLSLSDSYQNLKYFLNTNGYNLLNSHININIFCTVKNQINKIKKSNIITITL